MFIDEVTVDVKAGDGGNGCVSFRREKFVRLGGPDGGDGGRGGNIVFQASPALSTLLDFRYKRHFKADRGTHGKGKNMTGREGADLIIPVPVGTVVFDQASGEQLFDLSISESLTIAARGGRGGRGNARFASATHKAPRFAEKGEPGEERKLRFELKLLADVGIIGFPNAGKSTLLSRVSAARPKIADYPFTTLAPELGVVSRYDKQIVFADIPGLIAGAHEGAGLGTKFLKHIERTRMLIHLIDLTEVNVENPFLPVETIGRELSSFNPRLAQLPQIYVGNKMDLPSVREKAPSIARAFEAQGDKLFLISAATGEGIPELLDAVFERFDSEVIKELGGLKAQSPNPKFQISNPQSPEVRRESDHFRVIGKEVERAVQMTYLDNDEAVLYLQNYFSRYGIEAKLRSLGVKEGDLVKVGEVLFHYSATKTPKARRRR